MAKYQTTPDKRFKLLCHLVTQLNFFADMNSLLDELENVGKELDNGNPKSLEAICYFEDNILSILSEGKTVAELN